MTQPTDIGRESACPELLSAALAAAERGWHVFPLRPGTKRPALHGEMHCSRTGPCTEGHVKWEQRATTDPERLRAAWAAGAFNIAVATGPSGLVVLDLDVPKDRKDAPDGAATFKALCERAGHQMPATFTVRTAAGGWHLYFTAPPSLRLGNSAGRLGPLIDTRAWGGYVVAAGSTLPAGTYAVADDSAPAPLPEWLRDALSETQKERRPVAAPVARDASAYAAVALRNETLNVSSAPEGSRNWTLTRAARALGRLVAAGDLRREVVEEALKEAGNAAGLHSSDCAATVNCALNWSIAHNSGARGRAA